MRVIILAIVILSLSYMRVIILAIVILSLSYMRVIIIAIVNPDYIPLLGCIKGPARALKHSNAMS